MRILTDSACDLPLAYLQQHEVTFFSLRVELDGQDYADITDIQAPSIYEALRLGKEPKTSQVSPDAFYETFEQMAKHGEEGVYIAFSSALSGTYATAVMMYEQVKESYPQFTLHIIDSKSASLGQGLVVQEAVRVKESGATLDELVAHITAFAPRVEHIFVVDDLQHLARGGRISKSTAFVGGLLNIKPILEISKEGKIESLDKARGQKRAIKQMVSYMKERGVNLQQQTIGLLHCADDELLQELKSAIEAEFQPKGFVESNVGAVISSHVGLGTFAVFFQS